MTDLQTLTKIIKSGKNTCAEITISFLGENTKPNYDKTWNKLRRLIKKGIVAKVGSKPIKYVLTGSVEEVVSRSVAVTVQTQIVSQGPTYNFDPKTEINEIYDEINRTLFNGELTKIPVTVAHKMQPQGWYKNSFVDPRIQLKLGSPSANMRRTLIHEMAHQFVSENQGLRREMHGAFWIHKINQLGVGKDRLRRGQLIYFFNPRSGKYESGRIIRFNAYRVSIKMDNDIFTRDYSFRCCASSLFTEDEYRKEVWHPYIAY